MLWLMHTGSYRNTGIRLVVLKVAIPPRFDQPSIAHNIAARDRQVVQVVKAAGPEPGIGGDKSVLGTMFFFADGSRRDAFGADPRDGAPCGSRACVVLELAH